MLPFLLLVAATPHAFEDLGTLDQRVATVAADAEPIDKRLKLAQCPEQAVIAPPTRGSIVIRCPSKGWRLRVPVDTRTAEGDETEIFVHKGQMVEAISEGRGFSVSTSMIAVEDGNAGEAIRVKSPLSSVQITATVKSRGVVSF